MIDIGGKAFLFLAVQFRTVENKRAVWKCGKQEANAAMNEGNALTMGKFVCFEVMCI